MMIETIAAHEGRIAKVQGPARSGKTQALVARCTHLLKNGVEPATILVEVSSAAAAQAFRKRLSVLLPSPLRNSAQQVCVGTALNACVEVLNTPEAREQTQRIPRLLNNAEYNFFLEDMKTLGQPIRRLRKMLNFFYEQLSNLSHHDAWLPGSEEAEVFASLQRILSLHEAMLVQEAPALCADFLKSDEGEQARGAFDYVLCDDFQNLSHAEQTCLCLLAREHIMISGNPNEHLVRENTFPHLQGFVQFETLRHEVEVFTLTGAYAAPALVNFADALCKQGDMDPAFKACEAPESTADAAEDLMAVKWATPDEELNGITKYLRVLLDAPENEFENRTCVVVPNKTWALMVKSILEQRGFSVSTAAFPGLSGDPRESARARALVAYTKLTLLANPRDLCAWRSWCGFDNHLTNSDVWSRLQDYAQEQGISLYEALASLAQAPQPPFLRAEVLAERWQQGQHFIEKHAARKGHALMSALEADALVEFEDLARAMVGTESAQELYAMQCQAVFDPLMPDDEHVLPVVSYASLSGLEFDTVFALAAIDGFIPSRDAFEVVSTPESREALLNAQRKAFYHTITKANKKLVISYFSQAPLEVAERTKMQVVRVKADQDARVALVRPTQFLTEAQHHAPCTTGGQALLARHELI